MQKACNSNCAGVRRSVRPSVIRAAQIPGSKIQYQDCHGSISIYSSVQDCNHFRWYPIKRRKFGSRYGANNQRPFRSSDLAYCSSERQGRGAWYVVVVVVKWCCPAKNVMITLQPTNQLNLAVALLSCAD